MTIAAIETALYRIELPVPLSDSTHGTMTHFELVTGRLRDPNLTVHWLAAAPNRSYLEVHGFGLDRCIARPMPIIEAKVMAPDGPGHGVAFDCEALEKPRVS